MLLQTLKKNTLSKLSLLALIKAGSLFALLFLLSSCMFSDKQYTWEGRWQRMIYVPAHVQGRCVSEQLIIEKRIWQLKVTLYPTYECKDAYLQLLYLGNFDEVQIKKHTDDRQLSLLVQNIHLVKMVDILAGNHTELSGNVLKQMSLSKIALNDQKFKQTLSFAKDKNSFMANIYPPVLEMAIPDYPEKDPRLLYKKQLEQNKIQGQ